MHEDVKPWRSVGWAPDSRSTSPRRERRFRRLRHAGVFRAVRPRGPLDAPEEAEGPALETLVLQHLRAWNDYRQLGYSIHYWRTREGDEVDFALHGERGLHAIEVKRSARIRQEDFKSLARFRADYPQAHAVLLHAGSRRWHESGVDVVPLSEALPDSSAVLPAR